jgi:hypothetical protein
VPAVGSSTGKLGALAWGGATAGIVTGPSRVLGVPGGVGVLLTEGRGEVLGVLSPEFMGGGPFCPVDVVPGGVGVVSAGAVDSSGDDVSEGVTVLGAEGVEVGPEGAFTSPGKSRSLGTFADSGFETGSPSTSLGLTSESPSVGGAGIGGPWGREGRSDGVAGTRLPSAEASTVGGV